MRRPVLVDGTVSSSSMDGPSEQTLESILAALLKPEADEDARQRSV